MHNWDVWADNSNIVQNSRLPILNVYFEKKYLYTEDIQISKYFEI